VIRVLVFSIVLALAIGPNAALPCLTGCEEPQAVAVSGCHDEDAVGSMSLTQDTCDHVVLHTVAFLEDQVRRAPVPDAGHGVVTSRYQLTPPMIQGHPWHGRGSERSIEHQPISTALRI